MKRTGVGSVAGWAVALSTASLVITGETMLVLFVALHPGKLPAQAFVSHFYDVPLVLAFAVVSVVILRRLPRHPIGWMFGILAAHVGITTFADPYATWGLPGTTLVLCMWNVSTGPAFFALAMALLLFPTGRPASPRWRWLARLLWLYVAVMVLVSTVSQWPNRIALVDLQVQWYLGWPHRNPFAWNGQGWLSGAYALEAPVGVLLILASLLSLLPRWRAATGDERQQIKWLGLAALLFSLTIAFGLTKLSIFGDTNSPLQEMVGQAEWTLILIGIPVAIGLAILRYRLYDIDVLVSKTIVFGGLVAFIGLAYVVGVVVVGQVLGRAGSDALPALTVTAVVAMAFQPLRSWLQSNADRWVFGQRAAPYELMTRFGHELGQALGSADTLERIAEAAAQAIRTTSARVTAILPSGDMLTAGWPATDPPPSYDIVTPVYYDGTAIAEISVASAVSRPADTALLQQIASVSAAALRNVRLLAELESLNATLQRQNQEITLSKNRLLAAAAAQRQQLEQVVAQRLGPDLNILRETLPTLWAEVGDRPDAVAAGCQCLVTHATRLVDEMRALSRGVLPPILADHGLAAALRAKLRRLDHDVRFEVEPSITGCRFPAHVETTVYLCCQAAIDAAAADRGTAAVVLQLSRADSALMFSLTHNAAGTWSHDLAASRDRITTLGGVLNIHRDGQRTTVTGTMPLDHEPHHTPISDTHSAEPTSTISLGARPGPDQTTRSTERA